MLDTNISDICFCDRRPTDGVESFSDAVHNSAKNSQQGCQFWQGYCGRGNVLIS